MDRDQALASTFLVFRCSFANHLALSPPTFESSTNRRIGFQLLFVIGPFKRRGTYLPHIGRVFELIG